MKDCTSETLKNAIADFLAAKSAHENAVIQEDELCKKRQACGRKVLQHFGNCDDLLLKVSDSLLLRIPGEWYESDRAVEPGVEDLITTDSYNAKEQFGD